MKTTTRLLASICLCASFIKTTGYNCAYKTVSVTERKIHVYKTGNNLDRWCVVAIESFNGQPTLYVYDRIVVEQGKASRRLVVPSDAEFFVVVDGDDQLQKLWVGNDDVQLNIDDTKRVTIVDRYDCCG